MVKWLSCLPSKQAARVRFPFGVIIFFSIRTRQCGSTCAYLASSMTSMKQLHFKCRRVSSNPDTPLRSSDSIFTSPKSLRITTCSSCHRSVRLKSNPVFFCARFMVFSSCVSTNVSPYIWVNTADATLQHVLFACGRARVIQHLPPFGQVLSTPGAIRPPFHFLKTTRTTHLLRVEDVRVTKIAITFRSRTMWIASGLAVDRPCAERVASNTLKGQNPLNRIVRLSPYRTCSVGPSPAWTARQSNSRCKPTNQILRCKELRIQTTV